MVVSRVMAAVMHGAIPGEIEMSRAHLTTARYGTDGLSNPLITSLVKKIGHSDRDKLTKYVYLSLGTDVNNYLIEIDHSKTTAYLCPLTRYRLTNVVTFVLSTRT